MVHVVLYALVPFVLEEAVGANAIATAPPYHTQPTTISPNPLHYHPLQYKLYYHPNHYNITQFRALTKRENIVVANMEGQIVAESEVDKVADKKADMAADQKKMVEMELDMVADKKNDIQFGG